MYISFSGCSKLKLDQNEIIRQLVSSLDSVIFDLEVTGASRRSTSYEKSKAELLVIRALCPQAIYGARATFPEVIQSGNEQNAFGVCVKVMRGTQYGVYVIGIERLTARLAAAFDDRASADAYADILARFMGVRCVGDVSQQAIT